MSVSDLETQKRLPDKMMQCIGQDTQKVRILLVNAFPLWSSFSLYIRWFHVHYYEKMTHIQQDKLRT